MYSQSSSLPYQKAGLRCGWVGAAQAILIEMGLLVGPYLIGGNCK